MAPLVRARYITSGFCDTHGHFKHIILELDNQRHWFSKENCCMYWVNNRHTVFVNGTRHICDKCKEMNWPKDALQKIYERVCDTRERDEDGYAIIDFEDWPCEGPDFQAEVELKTNIQ